MKKQYMDFVPTRSTHTSVTPVKKPASPAVTTRKVTKTNSSHQPQAAPVRASAMVAQKRAPRAHSPAKSTSSSQSAAAALGIIEDLTAQTMGAPAPKPTVSNSSSAKRALKTIKSQKIGIKAPVKPVEKPVENSAKKSTKTDSKSTFMPPKFINQDKVVKRPLSKNVYRKTVEPAKESTSKKPVTIIAKPEKDTKVGIIITVIITIILAAAAGTIAYLLLPK